MAFFNFFKRKKSIVREKKSFFPTGDFIDFLVNYGHTDLAAYATIDLYNKTAPLWNCVDIISVEFSSLSPVVKDKNNNNEIVNDHPVLTLLENPHTDMSKNEFLYSFCAFFLITGNSYTAATGDIYKEPKELSIVYPQTIQITPCQRDGFALEFISQTTTGSTIFKRDETRRRFRYYYNEDAELWQIKRFNPNLDILSGQTPVSSILPEIDQYNYSSIHNVSLLKRGGRPSGVLLSNTSRGSDGKVNTMTDDQFSRLKEQTNKYLVGAQNAGRILLAEGPDLDYKDMMTSNRDMDYIKGRQDVRHTIYNQYHIPLPYIHAARQTFANMSVAEEQLYDNAVLPVANRLFGELNLFLMPRYKDGDRFFLTYDDSKIEALQRRKTREVKEKQETGIYTINELRTLAGKEALDDGGNMIYRPASFVPVSEDQYTDDQFSTPQKTSKKRFSEIMLKKGYNLDKVEEMVSILGLR